MKTFTHGLYYGYHVKHCRCEPCSDAMRRVRARGKARGPAGTTPTHGYSGYVNYSCRCEICKAAWAVENLKARARRSRDVPDEHGTLSGYLNYACRCDECREAKRDYYANRHASAGQALSRVETKDVNA